MVRIAMLVSDYGACLRHQTSLEKNLTAVPQLVLPLAFTNLSSHGDG
jgi:hypothetical protein